MKRAAVALLLALVVPALALPAVTRAEEPAPRWPPAAEKRYQDALELSKQGRHREAADAFRSIADWPEGGRFRERAQALDRCANELELAGDLEEALATYRAIEERFASDPFAAIARRNAERLDPPGTSGGLEFRRRHDAALAVLLPALALAERRELARARPDLERALELLLALERDFAKHPQAVDVVIAISDVLVRLERLDEALAAAEQAVRLARERAALPAAPALAAADTVGALRQLDEAERALRLRRVGRGAKALLVLLAASLAARRPWRRADRRVLRLGVALLGLDVLLALLGAGAAEYVRRVHAPTSPIDAGTAALLVLVPGAAGALLATGFALTLRGKKGVLLAALAGVLGALAVSTCLVEHYGFFDFLPDL